MRGSRGRPMHSTAWTALGAAVAIHQRTVERLVQRVYDQPLINNVERGTYVEHMVELALGEQQWRLTWPWASWDLEHRANYARIEIKQSAARAIDHNKRPCDPPPPTIGKFAIKPSDHYYLQNGKLVKTKLQRHAHLYVFAWHPEEDLKIADHRRPDQWEFFVVPERCLLPPEKKGIALGPLKKLVDDCDLAEFGDYEALPAMVTKVLESLPENSLMAAREAAAARGPCVR